MKRIILIIMLLIPMFAQSILPPPYGDTLDENEKQELLENFRNGDFLIKSFAIDHIIYYKLTEVLKEAEDTYSKQKYISIKLDYLNLLTEFKSSKAHLFITNLLDSLDIYNDGLFSQRNKEEAIYRLNYYLLKIGDYSNAEVFFNNTNENYYKTEACEIILEKVPELKEKAKLSLMNLLKHSKDASTLALIILEKYYPDEICDIMFDAVGLNPDWTNRAMILDDYIELNCKNLEEMLKKIILNENKITLKYDAIEILLNKYCTIKNINIVKQIELNALNKSLLGFKLKELKYPKPDSSVTVDEMLDSLKSYNQECYKIKWIKSEVLFQKLGALINNTETAISENKIKVATINLQQIINLVEASDSSQINKLGIKFIKYHAKYLWERMKK